MKLAILLVSLLLSTIVFSAGKKLYIMENGQMLNFKKHAIYCPTPEQEAKSCYVQTLKNKKYGIVLPDGDIQVARSSWALINKLGTLYQNETCTDYYQFSTKKKIVMKAGTQLRFSNKVLRCPASYRKPKTCVLKNIRKDSNEMIIKTSGGLVLAGGMFSTLSVKLKKLVEAGVCQNIMER